MVYNYWYVTDGEVGIERHFAPGCALVKVGQWVPRDVDIVSLLVTQWDKVRVIKIDRRVDGGELGLRRYLLSVVESEAVFEVLIHHFLQYVTVHQVLSLPFPPDFLLPKHFAELSLIASHRETFSDRRFHVSQCATEKSPHVACWANMHTTVKPPWSVMEVIGNVLVGFWSIEIWPQWTFSPSVAPYIVAEFFDIIWVAFLLGSRYNGLLHRHWA
ncbi:hypothetical protein HG531_009162 [Fusarium graminearum]|nr:hypothetical protein HG531_009162 [Fusarium graminearum]